MTSFHFERSNIKLGSGGNGEVHLGRETCSHTLIAIKKSFAKIGQNKSARECAIAPGEHVMLERHKHQNIVPILGHLSTPQVTFIALALQDSDLSVEIGAGKTRLSEDVAKLVLYPVLAVLAFLHGSRIAHRDVKPGNILLRRDLSKILGAHVYLGDFGQAHYVADDDKGAAAGPESGNATTVDMDDEQQTKNNVSCAGTYYYLSPELLNGKVKPSGTYKCDMWAFGCTLYEMLAGVAAFSGATQFQVINMIHKRMGTNWEAFPAVVGPQSLLDGIGESMSENCRSLLMGLLALSPAERLSASEALAHPFFDGIAELSDRIFCPDEAGGNRLLDLHGFALFDITLAKFKPLTDDGNFIPDQHGGGNGDGDGDGDGGNGGSDGGNGGPATAGARHFRSLDTSDESSIHMSQARQHPAVQTTSKVADGGQHNVTFSNMRTTALFHDGSSMHSTSNMSMQTVSPPRACKALAFEQSPSPPPPREEVPRSPTSSAALFGANDFIAEGHGTVSR